MSKGTHNNDKTKYTRKKLSPYILDIRVTYNIIKLSLGIICKLPYYNLKFRKTTHVYCKCIRFYN